MVLDSGGVMKDPSKSPKGVRKSCVHVLRMSSI